MRRQKQVIESLRTLPSRDELPRLLNDFGMLDAAAEVGVERAGWSEVFRRRWMGKVLHLIDCWAKQDHGVYPDPCHAMDHDENLAAARRVMSQFAADSYAIKPAFSVEASRDFPDGHFDLVYIDGNHSYAAVVEDIKAWRPKVKPGGILAGHDYVAPNEVYGVKWAVDQFAAAAGLELVLVPDRRNSVPSWAVVLPEQP